MTVMWHSKSKVSGSKTVQEAGRLGMETMANDIKSADGTVNNVKNFKIIPSMPGVNNDKLEVYQNNGEVTNIYTLSNSAVTMNDQPLTSPDVNITELKFEGQDGGVQGANPKEPYVTIEMTVRTVDQTDVNKKDSAVFRTTVITSDIYSDFKSTIVTNPFIYLVDDTGDWLSKNSAKTLTRIWNGNPINPDGSNPSSSRNGGTDLASDGQYLYILDDSGDWLIKVDPNTLVNDRPIIRSQAPNDGNRGGNGVTVMGDYVYAVDNTGNWLCKRNKTDLTKVWCKDPINTNGTDPNRDGGTDITNDGQYLYITQNDQWTIKVNPNNLIGVNQRPEMISQIVPHMGTNAITASQNDNKYLYMVDDSSRFMAIIDKNTIPMRIAWQGNPVDQNGNSFSTDGSDIATDGTYVYVTNDGSPDSNSKFVINKNPDGSVTSQPLKLVKKESGSSTGGNSIAIGETITYTVSLWEYIW